MTPNTPNELDEQQLVLSHGKLVRYPEARLADAKRVLEDALAWEASTRRRLGLPQVDAPEWVVAALAFLAGAEMQS